MCVCVCVCACVCVHACMCTRVCVRSISSHGGNCRNTCLLVLSSELMALSELIGPYGIRLIGEKLMEQVSSQTKEIKRLVVANKDVLLNMYQNKDKPELFQEASRRLRSEGCRGCGGVWREWWRGVEGCGGVKRCGGEVW